MSDEEAVRHAFKDQFVFTTNWGRVVMMRSNGSQTILGESWMEARANIAPVVMTLTLSAQDSTVVFSNGREFMCNRCGATQSVSLPMHFSKYGKAADAFSALHRECSPPKQDKGDA